MTVQGKRWIYFVWDENNTHHLGRHCIETWEAEEVFFRRYIITPNKKRHGPRRYRVDGTTESGRSLRLIVEDLGSGLARIITGWDL